MAAPLRDAAEAPIAAPCATAGPWIRYAARLADVLLFTLILDRTPLWNTWAPHWLGAYAGNQLLTGVLSGTLWLPFEAFGLAWKSTTPGKWFYSLRVRQLGGAAPGTALAVKRALWVFVAGLAFGLRPASVILLLLNYRRIERGEPAYWDHKCGTVVERSDLTPGRLVLGLLVTVILGWLLVESRSHPALTVPTLIA